MEFVTYLAFNGDCREAFQFYEKVFNGKIEMMMTNGESPMAAQMPPEQHGRIMHARMSAAGAVIMGGDAPPQHTPKPAGFSVAIQLKDADEADRIFPALAEGGQVKMPIGQTFWAKRFGMLIDRFGIPWMVNCE